MRRESSQLPSQPIINLRNHPPTVHQPLGSNHQFNVPSKNPQFENVNVIFEPRSSRNLKDPYQDQVKEVSTDASQNMNLEEDVSTETNPMKESELSTDIDLSEKKENG